jgi:two-component system sensor kinase FixL
MHASISKTLIEGLLRECKAQLAAIDDDALGDLRDRLERRIQVLQEVLAYLQSLTEFGQAMSALLFEVSHPLTAITNYIAGCSKLVGSGQEQLAGGLDRAADQTGRASQIVERIRQLL